MSRKNGKLSIENDSIWIRTPLHDFSLKYIINKHVLCHDPKRIYIYHQKNISRYYSNYVMKNLIFLIRIWMMISCKTHQ